MPVVYTWSQKRDKETELAGYDLSRKVVIPDRTLHKFEDEEIIEDLRWLEASRGSSEGEREGGEAAFEKETQFPHAVGMPYDPDICIESDDEEDNQFYKIADGNIYRPPVGAYLRSEEQPNLKSRGEIAREFVVEGLKAIRSDTFVIDDTKETDSENLGVELESRVGVPDGRESPAQDLLLHELKELNLESYEDQRVNERNERRKSNLDDINDIVSTIKHNLKVLREKSTIESTDYANLGKSAPEVAAILTGSVDPDKQERVIVLGSHSPRITIYTDRPHRRNTPESRISRPSFVPPPPPPPPPVRVSRAPTPSPSPAPPTPQPSPKVPDRPKAASRQRSRIPVPIKKLIKDPYPVDGNLPRFYPYILRVPAEDRYHGRGPGQLPRYHYDNYSTASFAASDRYDGMPNRIGYHRPRENSYADDDDMFRHEHQAIDNRGKLVTFFRNGDPHFKGLKTSISQKQFLTFETLLMWLNEKVPTTTGVRHLFVLPDGYEVKEITEIEGGKSYVVSGVKKLNTGVVYGYSKENYWSNKKMSAGKGRRTDRPLFRENADLPQSRNSFGPSFGSSSQINGAKGPRIFTLISNTNRDCREKVYLNPNTSQPFEDLLQLELTQMLKMANPPVQSLYTAREPFRRVEGYSQLFREYKNHDTFIACGRELLPYELKQRGGGGEQARDDDDRGRESPRQNGHAPTYSRRPKKRGQRPAEDREDVYERTPRNHQRKYSPQPDRNRREDPREVRSDIRDNRPPPYREANDRYDRVPYKPYQNRGRAYGPMEEEEEAEEEEEQYNPNLLDPYNNYRDRSRPRDNRYQPNDEDYAGRDRSPRPVAFGQNRPPSPRQENYQYIDKRRYKGDNYNKLPKRTGPMGDEKRFNVSRVDIHGKRREFFAPTVPDQNDDGAVPDRSLALDWVYGYRGKDSRNNLFVIPSGEVVYFVSNIAVVYDKKRDRQRHYTEHTEEISCMAIHPNLSLVASGQSGGKYHDTPAHIRIWDPNTMRTKAVIGGGVFTKGIVCVAFSSGPKGDFLIAIDRSNKHVMTLWNFEEELCVAKTTTAVGEVVGAQFHPQDESVIISYGKGHIFFWKVFWEAESSARGYYTNARILRDKHSGNFNSPDIPEMITALAFCENGDVITGDTDGSITVWSRDSSDAYCINHSCSRDLFRSHDKPVLCLTVMPDGTVLSGGGTEIKAWDGNNSFRELKERVILDSQGSVRSIVSQHYEGADGHIYVGTTKNMILEGSMQEKFSILIQGHSDELWAMTTHPFEHAFFTASYDMQVIKWSTITHKIMWRTNIEKPCLCIAVNSSGSLVAVGTTVGRVILMDAMTGYHISSLQVTMDQLGCLAFSPDGSILAVGSHDHCIYVFDVLDDGQCLRKHSNGVLTGHRNFVTQLDWSSDGKNLQSVSGDYDLRFWDMDKMSREKNGSKFCDTDWHTQSCVLGHCTLGSWSNLDKGEDINTVCRSNYRDLLAVGENRGTIKLYKYPCSIHKAEFTSSKAYTSHVTSVRFTFNDSYLITTGGTDDAIMQWCMVEGKDYNH